MDIGFSPREIINVNHFKDINQTTPSQSGFHENTTPTSSELFKPSKEDLEGLSNVRIVKDATTIKVVATKKSKVILNKASTTTHPYNVKSNVNNGGTKRSTIAEKVKKDAPVNSTARLGTFNSRKTTQTSMTTKMSTTGKKTDKTIATNQESKKSITIATKKKKVPTKEPIKKITTKNTKETNIKSPNRSSTRKG